MDNWHHFLAQQGAQLDNGIAVSFGETAGDYAALSATTTLTDIGDQGLLAFRGPHSAKFLQGQITCDINLLNTDTSIIGAICNLKGRVTTSFRLIEASSSPAIASVTDASDASSFETSSRGSSSTQILMSMHRDLIAATLATLEKYAVFSKTTLTDCSADYRQFGIAGPNALAALATLFPEIPDAINSTSSSALGTLIRIDGARFLILAPRANAESIWQKLAEGATATGLPFWQLLNIHGGIAAIGPDTSGEFVPQMLNYQAVGAVSFKKGCYTGQEIVARMQYLGKLKRRLYRLSADAVEVPCPGAVITLASGAQEVGQVVLAARADANTLELLAVLTSAAAAQSQLEIAGAPAAVTLLPLPYTLDKP